MENLQKLKKRILVFIAVFGPATIAAVADNDAAGVATYSVLGAQFGYSVLFVLFLITPLLAITQELGVKIGLVTGKGLGGLIRERYGIVVACFMFLLLFFANIGTIIANFSALKTVTTMFHIPTFPFVVFTVIFASALIMKGDYKVNQRIFMLGIIFYFAYLISAFNASPDWSAAFRNLVSPAGIKLTPGFMIASISLLGTTITPWGQFFVQSFSLDKKLTSDKFKYLRLETYFGAFLTNFFSFFMIVATAATLYRYGIVLKSGEDAAIAIRPFAGELAGILFGLGLLNAAVMGIVIIAMTTAYAFAEFFGYEGSLDVPFMRGRLFYGIFLFQLIIAAFVSMIPSISLFQIVFVTQFLNGILLPVIFYFLIKISSDRDTMGSFTNKPWYNYLLFISSGIIILSVAFTIISSLFFK